MIPSNFVTFSPDQFERPQRTPLPPGHTVNNLCATGSTCALRKQSSERYFANDVQHVIALNEISERARECSERRRLRRHAVLKSLATSSNPCEVESPVTIRVLKSHPPPFTPAEPSNQAHLPIKLARKPFNYQLNPHSSLATPGPHEISDTHELHVPYSESRGELQRQFAVSQRPQQEYSSGPREVTEADAALGRFARLRHANIRVPGLRLQAEKLLQRVSAHRIQRICRGGSPKKVRFATVVEYFEF